MLVEGLYHVTDRGSLVADVGVVGEYHFMWNALVCG